MSKSPTHTDNGLIVTHADAVSQDVIDALASAVYPSDVGEVRLSELSPQGAVYLLAYGVRQAVRDASANVKAEVQALALKAVLSPDTLSADEQKEVETLEENFDNTIQDDADEKLLRNVARGYITAVASQMGVQLTPEAIKAGVDAYFAPNGPKAPSYPSLMRVFGLVKSVVTQAKRARLEACRDGTIGQPKARPGKAAKADSALAALGLFG